MPLRNTRLVLLAALLLWVGTARAESHTTRLVADATENRFEALQEFLNLEGYWDDEISAVLDPLEGQLSLGHGTPDAHLIETLDDLPGLRPLPEGTMEFLHGAHNVYYVAVGKDRLLLGISSLVIRENGRTVSTKYHFEKFDLINGGATVVTPEGDSRPVMSAFLAAHDTFLPLLLRLNLLGTAFLVFLALRLRRDRARCDADGAAGSGLLDPLIRVRRLQGQVRVFQVSAVAWLLMLAAVYGLMHFLARIRFFEAVSASQSPSASLTRMMVLVPDRLRLIGFGVTESLALLTILLLGWWAGVFGWEGVFGVRRGGAGQAGPARSGSEPGGRP